MNVADDNMVLLDFTSETLRDEFSDSYGLLAPEETILVRAYSDDTDDRMLDEIKPKFIVMFEPDMDFVRRIEVVPFTRCFFICSTSFSGLQEL
jgi:DNA excision repair protein ERCC-4